MTNKAVDTDESCRQMTQHAHVHSPGVIAHPDTVVGPRTIMVKAPDTAAADSALLSAPAMHGSAYTTCLHRYKTHSQRYSRPGHTHRYETAPCAQLKQVRNSALL